MKKQSKYIRQLNQLRKLSKKYPEIRLAAEDWKNDYKILFSTILSARTRDEITIPVAERLFVKYPNTKSLSKAKLSEIKKIIKSVNFYKNKSRNIINCAKEIEEKYSGKIPKEIDKLIELPGVGRKTANVFLSELGKNTIGVDTHVSHISRELGWSNNSNPHKIERDLQKLFPEKYWGHLNPILVRFGKTHTSRKRKDEILKQIKKIK